jgi:hypothetical protein
METPVRIDSRFPNMGTTIFTVMSRLAAECGAINLSQGFPDFQAEPSLFDAMHRHMLAGRNQYAPMAGMPELRQAIVDKVARCTAALRCRVRSHGDRGCDAGHLHRDCRLRATGRRGDRIRAGL